MHTLVFRQICIRKILYIIDYSMFYVVSENRGYILMIMVFLWSVVVSAHGNGYYSL